MLAKSSGPIRSGSHIRAAARAAPYSVPKKVAFEPVPADDEESDLTPAPDSSDSGESEVSEQTIQVPSGPVDPRTLDDDVIIPKPPGEVTRPGRGGYSLDRALGWPDALYDTSTVSVSRRRGTFYTNLI